MTGEKRTVYNLFYGIAGLLALLFVFFTYKENHNVAGWLLTLFFISLAIAFRGHHF